MVGGRRGGCAEVSEVVGVVGAGSPRVEGPVPGDQVDVSVSTGGWALPGHPDPAETAVRRGIEESRRLREICRVVADHPAVVRLIVSVRRPGDVYLSIQQ